MTSSPVRVAVTRPAAQSALLLELLQQLAIDHPQMRVINCPLVRITDAADGGSALREAVQDLESYQWVIFTSVNAVERTLTLCSQIPQTVALAAVGETTASAVRSHGAEVAMIAGESNARSLVEEMPSIDKGRVLFPCSSLADDTVSRGLEQKGWVVDAVEAYRTESCGPDEQIRSQVAQAEVVVFSSPSAVRSFVDNVTAPLPVTTAVCIGRRTADAATNAGFGNVKVAPSSTDEGLVQAVEEFFTGLSGGSG